MKNKLLILSVLLGLSLITGCNKQPQIQDYNEIYNVENIQTEKQEISSATENKDDILSEFSLKDIPEYNGIAYTVVNNNNPFFTDEDKKRTDAFETYSELDSLGRCGVAYANICKELQPTDKRGEIGSVKPSGWHTVKYNDIIETYSELDSLGRCGVAYANICKELQIFA